jgi:hypothetical protein
MNGATTEVRRVVGGTGKPRAARIYARYMSTCCCSDVQEVNRTGALIGGLRGINGPSELAYHAPRVDINYDGQTKSRESRQDPKVIEISSIYRIQVKENRCLEDETRGGMVASVTYPRVSRLSSRSSFAGY